MAAVVYLPVPAMVRRPHPVLTELPRALHSFGRGFGGLGAAQILPAGTVDTIASVIQSQEGWFPGSVAWRNNNPGNLVYVGQAGATLGDRGFARFATYQDGLSALNNQIQLYAGRGMTIDEMMQTYAPASDGNNPDSYAQRIAGALGVSSGTSLLSLGASSTIGSGGDVYVLDETPVFSTDVFSSAFSDIGSSVADVFGVQSSSSSGLAVGVGIGLLGLALLLVLGGDGGERRRRYA